MIKVKRTDTIDLAQLNEELAALNLPNFTGTRKVGRGEDAPYIIVKCGKVSPLIEADVINIVWAHMPMPPPVIDHKADFAKAKTDAERVTILAKVLRLL